MSDRPPSASPLRRFARLGSLVGRVGASVVAGRAAELAVPGSKREARRTANLIKNARRIAETLGEMKGAAMKVGQMLSLHEGMLPPEVAQILRSLQRETPPVPAEVMRFEVEGALGGKLADHFAEFEEEAFAAASIGQVHRARLHDGREVAVKVQYPLIDQIVRADLKNLKLLLGSLFGLVFDADFEPVWAELRDRLLEELDYEHEADNLRRMRELHAGVSEVVVPEVIPELSAKSVLTMERVEGIAPLQAFSQDYPQELRDQWGAVLFEFQIRGLFEHRLLHADPNLANFAFLDDGRVVVYDFGCLKRVPEKLAEGYRGLVQAVLDDRRADVPGALLALGIRMKGEVPVPSEVIDPYLDLFGEILRSDPAYTFGEDPELYDRILELGAANWSHGTDLHFPQDVIFIDRSLSGHFGNLSRLRATGPWREITQRHIRPAA